MERLGIKPMPIVSTQICPGYTLGRKNGVKQVLYGYGIKQEYRTQLCTSLSLKPHGPVPVTVQCYIARVNIAYASNDTNYM